jgi:uncharacterized protein (TIGR00159 family)
MIAIPWQGAVDFLVLALAIYLLLRWSREARALRLALGILGLRVGALLADQLDLLITSWVLDAATIVAVLALVVVFQPELRRALIRLDILGRAGREAQTPVLAAVASAAWTLAAARCGALIVIARRDSLADLVTAGVTVGGRVSAELLESIFRKESPVHDGAAIVEGDALTRVGVVLPLTHRLDIPAAYGTRHRAAMGLAERSDAIVVVTSEERGEVTLVWEDEARLMSGADELLASLTTLVGRKPAQRPSAPHAAAASRSAAGLAGSAVLVAALVWALTFLFPSRAVRVRVVPIEFTSVPAGLTVASQSADTLRVRLRGNPFLLDAVNDEDLIARCDLARAHEGANVIPLGPEDLDLPFGIAIEGIEPEQVRVDLKPGRGVRAGG